MGLLEKILGNRERGCVNAQRNFRIIKEIPHKHRFVCDPEDFLTRPLFIRNEIFKTFWIRQNLKWKTFFSDFSLFFVQAKGVRDDPFKHCLYSFKKVKSIGTVRQPQERQEHCSELWKQSDRTDFCRRAWLKAGCPFTRQVANADSECRNFYNRYATETAPTMWMQFFCT